MVYINYRTMERPTVAADQVSEVLFFQVSLLSASLLLFVRVPI